MFDTLQLTFSRRRGARRASAAAAAAGSALISARRAPWRAGIAFHSTKTSLKLPYYVATSF